MTNNLYVGLDVHVETIAVRAICYDDGPGAAGARARSGQRGLPPGPLARRGGAEVFLPNDTTLSRYRSPSGSTSTPGSLGRSSAFHHWPLRTYQARTPRSRGDLALHQHEMLSTYWSFP